MTRSLVASILFLATSTTLGAVLFGGCYTQVASTGDNYGYSHHEPVLVRSDTVNIHRAPPATTQAAPAPKREVASSVEYDTVIHGDTVFIDERPRTGYTQSTTEPNSSTNTAAETIVNNYYGGYPDDYYWWHPRRHAEVEIVIGSGWPWWGYHSWYSPWYDYGYYPSWYGGPWWYDRPYAYGWYYPGFYPPLYDCYSPYYGYSPYNNGYYGYGGYGRYGRYPGFYGAPGRRIEHGRIRAGEHRPGQDMASGGTLVNSMPPAKGQVGNKVADANTRVNQGTPRAVDASPRVNDVAVVTDRNTPVHSVAPDANGGMQARGVSTQPIVIHRTIDANGNARVSAPDVTMSGASMSRGTAGGVAGSRVVIHRRIVDAGSSQASSGMRWGAQTRGEQPRGDQSGGVSNRGSAPKSEGTYRSAPRETPRESAPRENTGSSSRGESSGGGSHERGQSRGDTRDNGQNGGGRAR